jgi:hypothetical protein
MSMKTSNPITSLSISNLWNFIFYEKEDKSGDHRKMKELTMRGTDKKSSLWCIFKEINFS